MHWPFLLLFICFYHLFIHFYHPSWGSQGWWEKGIKRARSSADPPPLISLSSAWEKGDSGEECKEPCMAWKWDKAAPSLACSKHLLCHLAMGKSPAGSWLQMFPYGAPSKPQALFKLPIQGYTQGQCHQSVLQQMWDGKGYAWGYLGLYHNLPKETLFIIAGEKFVKRQVLNVAMIWQMGKFLHVI